MNEQEEKIKHYEILAQGYNQDMLHSVLDFSKMGLKAGLSSLSMTYRRFGRYLRLFI